MDEISVIPFSFISGFQKRSYTQSSPVNDYVRLVYAYRKQVIHQIINSLNGVNKELIFWFNTRFFIAVICFSPIFAG